MKARGFNPRDPLVDYTYLWRANAENGFENNIPSPVEEIPMIDGLDEVLSEKPAEAAADEAASVNPMAQEAENAPAGDKS